MKINLKKHGLPGKLLVVCGTDGSGKSTLIRSIMAYLNELPAGQRRKVIYAVQPSDWWRSDARVKSTILHIGDGPLASELAIGVFAIADRINQQEMVIEPELRNGSFVIMDRYIYSLFSYYMAHKSSDLDYLADCSHPLFAPDMGILVDCDPEVAVERVKKRDGVRAGAFDQDLPFVSGVISAFRDLARSNGLEIFSSMRTEAEMHEEAIKLMTDASTRLNFNPGPHSCVER